MEKRNENLRFENTTLEMREASVDEIEYYQAFEEYEDLPHFMDANPYEDEICPYKQMKMFIKKSFMDDLQRLVDVVNKQKSQPAYKEFLNFLEIEGLENPIDGMVESLSGMMQSDSDV